MRVPVRWLSLVVAATALAACAGPVAVPVPSPTSTKVASVCAELKRQLPSAVANAAKRKIEPESDLTAAWGDPPITLRCGVPRPTGLTPTSELISINSVDWFPEQRSAGYVFVTTARVANVEVAVPDAYQPETEALVDLTNAIKAADPPIPTLR